MKRAFSRRAVVAPDLKTGQRKWHYHPPVNSSRNSHTPAGVR